MTFLQSSRFFSTQQPPSENQPGQHPASPPPPPEKFNGMHIYTRPAHEDPMENLKNVEKFVRKDEVTGMVLSDRFDEVRGGPSRHGRYFMAAFALAFLFYYFNKYNEATKRTASTVTQYQTAKKVAIGGPFEGLIDMDGNVKSSSDFDGNYRLMYFGFTECPDICPTELRKMIKALKIVRANHPEYYDMIKPIFISVDTRRDTPARLKEYSKHFTPNIAWLTGPEENIRSAAKKYRVHYSLPENIEEGENYNVDHSIFFYFMDKNNEFVDFFGQNLNATEIAESIIDRLNTDHGKMDSEKFTRQKK